MIEIRIHGRGGQGAVTAAELLADAAFKDGLFSQAFPNFGVERQGAPVEAFCRIDSKFINLRQHVYEPDIVLVLDQSLIGSVDVKQGLKKGGKLIVNSANDIKGALTADATSSALKHLGKPIVNTAALGALAAFAKVVSLKSLKESVMERFPAGVYEKNVAALEDVYLAASGRGN